MAGSSISNGESVEAKQKMGKAGSSFDLGVFRAFVLRVFYRQLRAHATTNNSRSTSNPRPLRAHTVAASNCTVARRNLIGLLDVTCTSLTACILSMRQSSAV